jgi:hypothetical protein
VTAVNALTALSRAAMRASVASMTASAGQIEAVDQRRKPQCQLEVGADRRLPFRLDRQLERPRGGIDEVIQRIRICHASSIAINADSGESLPRN